MGYMLLEMCDEALAAKQMAEAQEYCEWAMTMLCHGHERVPKLPVVLKDLRQRITGMITSIQEEADVSSAYKDPLDRWEPSGGLPED